MRMLDVYLHGEFVGHLMLRDSGQMAFRYVASWLESERAVSLSHSLPLRTERFPARECAPFFGGVLPEGRGRGTIARVLGISEGNDFALLEAIGGECAGAVSLLPSGKGPDSIAGQLRELSEVEFGELLGELPKRPLLVGTPDLRLSLAGAQDKVAVRMEGDRMFLPLGGAASTHIVKPALPEYDGIVFNEAYCLGLAAACGLDAAPCAAQTANGTDYLIVERFDRARGADGEVERIHQEDFCQALGVRSERKYQSEGGPTLLQCFELVRAVSSAPVIDIGRLLDAVLFNIVIGNHDAHAKNFALLRHRDGRIRLAPLYDLICTVAYPELSQRMAMRVGRQDASGSVSGDDLERVATRAGLSASLVRRRAVELAGRIHDKAAEVDQPHAVARRVATEVRERASSFRRRIEP